MVDSLSVTVTGADVVAVAELPVQLPDDPEASPVNAPMKPVAVILPVDGLYVTVPSDSKPRLPVSVPPLVNTSPLFSLVD